MCGFFGGTEPSWNYRKALESIAHRGPDASKLCLDGIVKVGFRRLSIIDLRDDAKQPFAPCVVASRKDFSQDKNANPADNALGADE